MFSTISIKNLRGIKEFELNDLSRINLFVGTNNSSKTTILEALFFITAPVDAFMALKINNLRGYFLINEDWWRSYFYKLNLHTNIEIKAFQETKKEMRTLTISPIRETLDLSITKELTPNLLSTSSEDVKDISGLVINIEVTDKSDIKFALSHRLAEATGSEWGEGTQKDDKASKSFSLTVQNIGQKDQFDYHPLVSSFVTSKPIEEPLEQLKRFDKLKTEKKLTKLIKVLQKIEPSLIDITATSDGMLWCDTGLDRLIPLKVMGDGLNRILSILLAISNSENGTVLIDEIENGLYYTSLEVLWPAIYEASQEFNTQVFATTHSIDCIRAFETSYSNSSDDFRLFRIEQKKERHKAQKYDKSLLESALSGGWEVR